MKKTLFISVFTLFSYLSIAQSVTLSPNNLQIPSVSALPACAATDYGKIVFLTTTNKANVCSGSGWVEVAAGGGGSLTLPYASNGSFSTQGFQIINTGGGANSAALQGTTMSGVTDAAGIWGSANATSPTGVNIALRGSNMSTNSNGVGVKGTHAGSGIAVHGYSLLGTGVYGFTEGNSTSGYGVFGETGQISGVGVHGKVSGSNATAVFGLSTNSTANAGYFLNNAGGNAIYTSGKLRFAGNGAAANKVLTSFDATGAATWEHPNRTEILKLGPAAFHSHISTNASTMGSQGISMTTAAGSFHANVSVPNGASITAIKVYYIDNDGVSPATGLGLTSWALQKMTNSGAGSVYSNVNANLFTNISANANVLFSALSFPVPEVVNNATTLYRIVVTMPASLNLILVGAEISFTYEVTN